MQTPSAPPPDPPRQGQPRLRLRIVFDEARFLGPGKIELLGGIARTGSIAAAGREMGMSYKRAWDLVATLNAMFAAPLVASARCGAGGGGAVLTPMGAKILALYAQVEAAAYGAGGPALDQLAALLGDISVEK